MPHLMSPNSAPIEVTRIELAEMGFGEADCPVCFEEMSETDIYKLPCGHMFHLRCLEGWKKKRNTCPMCRTAMPSLQTTGRLARWRKSFARFLWWLC
ncbi:hypothetical protein EDC01DRAFT_638850 [Geopyxis carbonaria]|nr:hypothetical protein EDC01DRAFT_638850 [Geopyxis carbonaria]